MSNRAFTLIEMLVVVSIIALLLTLSVPAIRSMSENANISQGGQIIAAQVSLARQIASARNCNVEVRFIRLPATPGGSEEYHAVQLWGTVSGTESAALNRLTALPSAIIIADDAQRSPIIDEILAAPASQNLTGRITVSGQSADCAYTALRIAPSGRITPAVAMNRLFLTVIPQRGADIENFPNCVIVQIHPETGSELTYRP